MEIEYQKDPCFGYVLQSYAFGHKNNLTLNK